MKRQNCSCLLADDGCRVLSMDVSTGNWQEAPGHSPEAMPAEPNKDCAPKPTSVALLPLILSVFIFSHPPDYSFARSSFASPLTDGVLHNFFLNHLPPCAVLSGLVWSAS